MTDDQLDNLASKIADSVFKRLVAKQKEWDEQFEEQMTEASWVQVEQDKKNKLKSNQEQIEELKELLAKALQEEDYAEASKINSKIVSLKANKK
jgi:excinuclease UvrABC helicase subunit UvrB|tara:strand:+ start:405 stop:686 length:282 start_codon:yes stop_codon:yes gene_type:complete